MPGKSDGVETRARTLVRSVTWRVGGVILTVVLGYYFTHSFTIGLELGLTYNSIRLVTHYIHDRAWNGVAWGVIVWRTGESK